MNPLGHLHIWPKATPYGVILWPGGVGQKKLIRNYIFMNNLITKKYQLIHIYMYPMQEEVFDPCE